MAGFAGHAGDEIFLVKLASDVGSGGVAGEAALNFRGFYRAVHGFLKILRGGQRTIGGEVKGFERVEIGDARFVEFSVVFLEQIGLTDAVGSEGPKEVGGQGAGTVSDGVDAVAGGTLNLVVVFVEAEIQGGVGAKNVGIACVHGGAAHCRSGLLGNNCRVAGSAGVGPYKLIAESGVLRRPESGLGEMVVGGKLRAKEIGGTWPDEEKKAQGGNEEE